jgi:transposase-like protein
MAEPLELVESGRFCWNPDCTAYAKLDAGNLRRFGYTRRGTPRLQCKVCRKVFAQTKGTPFHGIHDVDRMLNALLLVAEGMSMRGVQRVSRVKPDTLSMWLEKAAGHVELVEALLHQKHQATRVQLDALWSFVAHKGEKGGGRKSRSAGRSGAHG